MQLIPYIEKSISKNLLLKFRTVAFMRNLKFKDALKIAIQDWIKKGKS